MTFTRCYNGLMMCYVNHDESATHVSKVARMSRLRVLFVEKLDILLDRLDNQRTMHISRSVAIDYWCGNRNGTC
jgi:ribosome assembly protein YihI (activator of Der GTPase)